MTPRANQLAFVFPGQGSQSLGMLAELAMGYPSVQRTFEQASAGCGLDLWAISQHGPKAELDRTEITQPALLAAAVAVWQIWVDSGRALPVRLAGHSLGEYSALVCAGALTLADAAALVRERGRLMQAAVAPGQGAMAAVLGAKDEVIAQACLDAAGDQVVAAANFNSPGQTVISGTAAAVARAITLLTERGVRKVIPLPVSVPSHCLLMRTAADALRERMLGLHWSLPQIPVIQNADARANASISGIQDALARQLYLPVRWIECVQALTQVGITRIGECGPGEVLTGLCKRIDRSLDARALATPAELATAITDWS